VGPPLHLLPNSGCAGHSQSPPREPSLKWREAIYFTFNSSPESDPVRWSPRCPSRPVRGSPGGSVTLQGSDTPGTLGWTEFSSSAQPVLRPSDVGGLRRERVWSHFGPAIDSRRKMVPERTNSE